jgi:NAD-dependent DNA ligase
MIYYVFEKFEIKGIGYKTILNIVQNIDIKNIFDFLKLEQKDLTDLEGFKEKKI